MIELASSLQEFTVVNFGQWSNLESGREPQEQIYDSY